MSFHGLARCCLGQIKRWPARSLLHANNCESANLVFVRNAGHAKWQNIASQKKASDGIRARNGSVMVNKAKVAIRMGGSADPKKNSLLNSVLEESKRKEVGKAIHEFLLKRQTRGEMKDVQVIMRGPGGSYVIIMGSTDKTHMFKETLKTYTKKKRLIGFLEEKSGAGLSMAFVERGEIVVAAREEGKDDLTLDRAEELAIECEAEDIELFTCPQAGDLFTFITSKEDMFKVKGRLEKLGVPIESFGLEFKATCEIDLSEEKTAQIKEDFEFISSELDDFDKLYTNIATLT